MSRSPQRIAAGLALAALTTTVPSAVAQEPPPTPAVTVAGRMVAAEGGTAIVVRSSGRALRVRLLGVADPGRQAGFRAACLRQEADAALLGRAPAGSRVTLVTTGDRDADGRAYAWAYRGTNSGVASLNRALVAAGYAPATPRTAGLRYGAALRKAERAARRARLGRWGTACGLRTIPGIQRRLADLGYLPAGWVNGTLDYRTQQAVMAFQGWSGLPRVGLVDTTTRRRLAAASRPVPSPGPKKGRRLEVDVDRQVLLLIEDGRVVRAIHVSTGAGGRTPRGAFSILRRERYSWSRPFQVTLPWAQYFYGGFAFHEYPSVPGYPASHGCVRLPAPEAPVLWDFTTYGTPVLIH